MKGQSDLFQLIKSLSKSEKRYFRLWTSLQEGEKKYLMLFEAMERQKEDNHEELFKIFHKERFVKQLHVAKNYLHKLILKSLNAYYAESSADTTLKALIIHVEILYEKSFRKQAVSVLKKAKKMAYAYENHNALLDILKWEKILHDFSDEKQSRALYEEERKVIDAIQDINSSWSLYAKGLSIIINKGILRDTKEIIEYKNIIRAFSGTTYKPYSANLYKYGAYADYFEIKGDPEKVYLYRKKIVELMEANPLQIEENGRRYIFALGALLASQGRLGRITDFLSTAGKLKNLPQTNKRFNRSAAIRLMIFTSSSLRELSTYIHLREYKAALGIAGEVEKGLEEYDGTLKLSVKMITYFNLAYVYFANRLYNEALPWVNKIIGLPKANIREDVQCFARILNLMIHSELKNNDVTEYFAKSTYQFLVKRKRLYQFETIILKFLKKYPSVNDPKKMKETYQKLKQELVPLLKDKFERIPFEHFDFIGWVTSKIEGKAFLEVSK